jgi:hypothetical protein
MDVSSLRLESLNLQVEQTKLFSLPGWAIAGNRCKSGAALHVLKEGEVVDTLKIDDDRIFTLFGRSPSTDCSGVAVKLEHPSVSRVHAALLRGEDDSIFVIDLGSSHGTFVSGARISPYSPVSLRDRSVIVFGQSSRRYIVRIFPKEISDCSDAEEANTLLNCMVSYKETSSCEGSKQMDEGPPKYERRVSFSCSAPEIIPPVGDGSSTPISIVGGSPEITMFRKLPNLQKDFVLDLCVAPTWQYRSKSDSLPSILINSGSDDDEASCSLDSLEMSPVLATIDETVSFDDVDMHPRAIRKSYSKRSISDFECLSKRVKPENLNLPI